MNKKGYRLQDLLPVALVFVVATIAISIGADILGGIQGNQVTGGASYNITSYGLSGLGELGSWIPTLALVVAAAIVIGVLVIAFAFRR